ncbi:unnamed protein product [Dovyalis caffra]|uniref:Core domain-containing protein n=1 Tax=Dovyalis caffra TaxID=77055 RepID=A0AAV1RM62_9ROSI|nr:unnamed protein product [Dovyalis caffra]
MAFFSSTTAPSNSPLLRLPNSTTKTLSFSSSPHSLSFRFSTSNLNRRNPSLSLRSTSSPAAPPAEGVAPAISVTENALKHLNRMKNDRSEDLCLRIGVKQGGCSGMSYTMDFENRANARPDDSIIECNGFVIGLHGTIIRISSILLSYCRQSNDVILYEEVDKLIKVDGYNCFIWGIKASSGSIKPTSVSRRIKTPEVWTAEANDRGKNTFQPKASLTSSFMIGKDKNCGAKPDLTSINRVIRSQSAVTRWQPADVTMQEACRVFKLLYSAYVKQDYAFCDPKSLLFIFGMQLDYSDALIGGGFSFKNPNATKTCGCGKSFAA